MRAAVASMLAVTAIVGVRSTSMAEPAANGTLTCNGKPATISGGFNDDYLVGTSGPDVIAGGGGDDRIRGRGADDIICGDSDGAQRPYRGEDTIWGGKGDDVLIGGPKPDVFIPGPGDDQVFGGDHLGSDTVSLARSSRPVTIDLYLGFATGEGADVLNSIESATGSEFDDTISGAWGPQSGTFEGRGGNDRIHTVGHHSLLSGGPGDDELIGDSTYDRALYLGAPSSVEVDLQSGTASGGDGNDLLTGIEELDGSEFDDRLSGDANDNFIVGRAGDDFLDGRDGEDELWGLDGYDKCINGESVHCEDMGSGQGPNTPRSHRIKVSTPLDPWPPTASFSTTLSATYLRVRRSTD